MDDLDLGATIKGLAAGQRVFGRYTLKKILGRGGMGVVWLAHDEELEQNIALKFLPETVTTDKAALDDLRRETRRSRELTFPHIVRIHDFVRDERSAAISMEYVDGETLSGLRLGQPDKVFSVDELRPWVKQLCAALDYAHHQARVVHRDLKPANLMVNSRGELKVADFGIARSLADSVTRVSRVAGTSGTPVYMSPQQLLGEDPSPADDIYALGATLYELLTGKPPFHSGDIGMQIRDVVPKLVDARRATAGLPPIDPAWSGTIAACLAKDPAARPKSAGEVWASLEAGKTEAGGGRREAVGRASLPDEPSAQTESAPQSKIENPKSRMSLLVGLAAAVVLLGGLGYYFGVYVPEKQRLAEIARLEAQGRAEEAMRLKNEQERATAEAARLAAARGGIVVRTTPDGAEVRVGAIALEKSPLTLKEQKLGRYPVRIRLEGYDDWDGEVEVKENEFTELNVSLVRSTGSVVITGTPGAEVVNASKSFGTIPLTLKRVPTGRVRFTISAKGYESLEVNGEVTQNAELRLVAALEKIPVPEVGKAYTIPDLNLNLVPIAPGTFALGSASGGESDERPVTQVTLTRPFWLGQTEVTQAQWSAVMGSNPSNIKGENRPVEQVSWVEAMEFCRKLTERERASGRLPAGYVYTLPTEAQWEYACRAGSTGDYAGNLDAMGWYDGNSGNQTHPVGQKQANAWGLHDMHGNVWEWCADWYGNYPGGRVADPMGASSDSNRVYRGGSWNNSAGNCRSAIRNRNDPGLRWLSLGFRPALSSVR